MNLTLSPQTQQLLEEQMRKCRCDNPDDLVRVALLTLDGLKGEDYDDLDATTRAAIEDGEAQFQRGEYRPWEEVREELRARFIKK